MISLPKNADFKDQALYHIIKLLEELNNKENTLKYSSSIENDCDMAKKETLTHQELREKDPFVAEIAKWHYLFSVVESDKEISELFNLSLQNTKGDKFICLIANISQLDCISDLWDILAGRCKSENRAVTQDEETILMKALTIHNFIWRSRKAEFRFVEQGATYNYEEMTEVSGSGDKVSELYLMGIVNSGGQLLKKPLVKRG